MPADDECKDAKGTAAAAPLYFALTLIVILFLYDHIKYLRTAIGTGIILVGSSRDGSAA